MSTKRFLSGMAAAGIALSVAMPAFAYTSTYDEQPTRRAIRGDRNQNTPLVGQIATFGGDRTAAVQNETGRDFLPLRTSIRALGLRNMNRHKLGEERGGMYQSLNYTSQGDTRRASSSEEEQTLSKSPLPPKLVQTGRGEDYTKPSRRGIRGNRNLNDYNRR
ncbi:MAG: hypothetical protein PHU04_00445 [Candidatus Peribacteraceae bacterium]|nr:hypothetical protein [Candidatus Peribacteraceae bacterium]